MEELVCIDCNGLGYYINGIYTPTCETCNGTGEVWNKKDAKEYLENDKNLNYNNWNSHPPTKEMVINIMEQYSNYVNKEIIKQIEHRIEYVKKWIKDTELLQKNGKFEMMHRAQLSYLESLLTLII